MRLPVDGSSYEVRQFVCVLADHGDTDGSRPVVVEMAQLVSQFLKETEVISLKHQLSHTDQKISQAVSLIVTWKCSALREVVFSMML